LCYKYKHNQQNQVHEHPCKEIEKFVKTCSNTTSAICGVNSSLEHRKIIYWERHSNDGKETWNRRRQLENKGGQRN
jgi:hypothetical protein